MLEFFRNCMLLPCSHVCCFECTGHWRYQALSHLITSQKSCSNNLDPIVSHTDCTLNLWPSLTLPDLTEAARAGKASRQVLVCLFCAKLATLGSASQPSRWVSQYLYRIKYILNLFLLILAIRRLCGPVPIPTAAGTIFFCSQGSDNHFHVTFHFFDLRTRTAMWGFHLGSTARSGQQYSPVYQVIIECGSLRVQPVAVREIPGVWACLDCKGFSLSSKPAPFPSLFLPNAQLTLLWSGLYSKLSLQP